MLDFGIFQWETDIAFFWSKGKEWKDSTFGKEEIQLVLHKQFWNRKQKTELQSHLLLKYYFRNILNTSSIWNTPASFVISSSIKTGLFCPF